LIHCTPRPLASTVVFLLNVLSVCFIVIQTLLQQHVCMCPLLSKLISLLLSGQTNEPILDMCSRRILTSSPMCCKQGTIIRVNFLSLLLFSCATCLLSQVSQITSDPHVPDQFRWKFTANGKFFSRSASILAVQFAAMSYPLRREEDLRYKREQSEASLS
jgi:hypothetical protein